MPIKILMPALSPTMTEGNLAKWLKKEGDTVESGDVLAEIETDKATMEIEAVDEGTLGRIVVPEKTAGVKVNEVIALLLEEGEDKSALDEIELETPAVEEKLSVAAPQPTPAIKPAVAATPGGRVIASPLAKRIASQSGIDLTLIKGTGPRGRITKADVEAAGATVSPQVAREGLEPPFDRIPISGIRQVVAQRLTESKQTVPHFYLTIDCEVDDLLKIRKQLNGNLENEKISVNDLIIRACALALMNVPEANAAWMGDHIRRYKTADISIAVAIEEGLITPIVQSAENKHVTEIAKITKDLIARARTGKLMPEEYQGGTFCISNMGMYGIKEFAAVINPPQGCILAIGAAEERVIVHEGKLTVHHMMTCTLSVDHRVIDGSVAAKFLQEFKRIITNPVLILV